jgi:hypothetical protein
LFKGDFVLATRPMAWEPPATAMIYKLHPMRPEQIEDFLKQQWYFVASSARLSCELYEVAVSDYVSQLRVEAATSDVPHPALTVLCNPMESALAAELLARGEKPDVFRLVEQCFDSATQKFRTRHLREFPRERFAERVYEWRLSGKPDLGVEGFEPEAEVLVEHKLLLRRTETLSNEKETREATKWMFRHDKIMDFFMAPAFLGDHADRQTKHMDDQSFSGVYEVLAFQLPLAQAEELQDFLVDWAAETNQNDLLNRFTRRLNARKAATQTKI